MVALILIFSPFTLFLIVWQVWESSGFVADGDLQGRVGVVVTDLRWAMWGCGSIGPSGKFLHG
jgi:hypothetical protein